VSGALAGKTVLITGAAGAFGRRLAESFAADGAQLVLIDVDMTALKTVLPGQGDQPRSIAVNLLDEEAVTDQVRRVEEELGGIDIMCAVAGGFHMGEPVHEISAEAWKRMDDMNVQTLLNTLRAVTPGMVTRGSGKIITIGANAALQGVPFMGAYCASKAQVMRITESLSGELREKGINVNCVLPTIIDTPANREAMPDADPASWVAPEDLAAVFKFLASDGAKAVHGALVPVAGLS